MLVAICSCYHMDRTVSMQIRSSHFWNFIVQRTFSTHDWYENFRMRKVTFDCLCTQLKPIIERKTTKLRDAILVEQRVAICIWCLATNMEYRTAAYLFGVSRSSVCLIVNSVSKAIVEIHMPKYIQLPRNNEELLKLVKGIKQSWGFPNCGGAIDGCHIPNSVATPLHTDYYNRKGYYSVILLGLVDYRHCFMHIYVGWPGSVHDTCVFSNSPIYRMGNDGGLFLRSVLPVNGWDVPVVILGDSAYPLLNWLMKPFPHGTTNSRQRNFNYSLSQTRMTVENSFGRLKARWRCLSKRLDAHIKTYQQS